jgi:hypothetical protein
LLLCCTRAAFGSDEAAPIAELVQAGIDWDALIRDAEALGVLPLLCRTSLPSHAVPNDVATRLETYLHSNARRNLFLARELLKIVRILEQHGIPCIPLKGPALAALAYGDLALRQYCDLDLLLRQSDILKATDALAAHQYALKLSFTPEQLAQELRSEHIHHLELVHPSRRMLIELHWHLMQERFFFTPDLDGIWDRRVQQSLVGTALNGLDPEDLVIFLCVHGWKHHWSRLIWIADLAGVIRNSTVDWPRLLDRATGVGSKRRVLLGFGLAKHLLRTPLDPLLEKEIRADRSLNKLILQAERMLFSQELPSPGRFMPYRQALEIGEGVSHRTRILFTFVRKTARLNENDFAWIKLPRPLFFLYYVLHPVRLAVRAAARAFAGRP